jgi:exodeoxyribonuclease X
MKGSLTMQQFALLIDCESTGLVEPQVIQLATKGPLKFGHHLYDFPATEVMRFKPTKAIEPGAMATHRIIATDLDECPTWLGFGIPEGVGYLIGHGVDYDWQAIGSPDLKRICTLALARNLWPDLNTHKLSALIFYLYEPNAARELTRNAHDAETDVHLTALLLDHLLWEMRGRTLESWETLWQASEEARIPLRLTFGKHGPQNGQPGALYSEVPKDYLQWMCRQADMDPWCVKAAERALRSR